MTTGLREQVMHVAVDGGGFNSELLRDFLVGQPESQQAKDLLLPPDQRRKIRLFVCFQLRFAPGSW